MSTRLAAVFLTLLLAGLLPATQGASPPAVRVSGPIRVLALAVAETTQGFVGEHSQVEATVLSGGAGRIYVSTKPFTQQDIQGSVRLAAQVAANTVGVDWRQQDYLVSFVSDSQVIGGPSAGGVMTLALTTALHNLVHPEDPWTLDPTVAGTGTINPDGTIGPVGGIPAKAEAAAAAGIRTFMYPTGQENATTEKAVNGQLTQVVVNMPQHCAALNITCRPETTIRDLLEAAAHVRIVLPDVPTPATSDYAALLSPGVTQQVDDLAARVDRAAAALTAANLAPSNRNSVQAEITAARSHLANAQTAVQANLFYQAATESFQGAISSGRAENLTAFYASSRSESVVTTALAGCQAAVTAAKAATDGLSASDLNAVWAVGSGQQRTHDAADLLAQATQAYNGAVTFNDWISSFETSTFCVERARTASWWAGLKDVFPAGEKVADLTELAQETMDQANDLVSYADAVLSSQVTDAHDKLTAAQAEVAAGHLPAAILDAVDAQSISSVALQTGGGTAVPATVLAAARDGASRAINQARDGGSEPMLSVSLVELAQAATTQSATSLQEYWSARTLALLDATATSPIPAAPVPTPSGSSTSSTSATVTTSVVPAPAVRTTGYTDSTLGAFMVMGFVLGLACAGLFVIVLVRRR